MRAARRTGRLTAAAAACLSLVAPAAWAEVRFAPESDALSKPHVYDGGWEHFVGGGVAVFDCDGDQRPEIVAAGGSNAMTLYRNRTQGEDWAFDASAAFPAITGATGAYPLDMDADGWHDLVVLRVGANMVLKGGPDCAFSDVTEAWGIEPGNDWSTAFSATWEKGADWPTLAIGNYVDRDDPDGPFGTCAPHQIFRHDGTRYRLDVALEPGYCTLSMLFSDWGQTGEVDLRISNDRHYHQDKGHEQMWRPAENRFLGPDDGFEPIKIWGMGIASRDVTGDGRTDVFLTSMGDQILQIARDTPGYEDAPFAMGTYAQRPYTGDDLRPSTAWHPAFGDVNNDGLTDLFIAKGNVDAMPEAAADDPNNLLIQTRDGSFEEAGGTSGVGSPEKSRGAALADFDLDGLLDLVVVNRGAPLELYRNITGDGGNSLALALEQPGGNRNAVGAIVTVTTPDGRAQMQEITCGGGHAGDAAVPLHFGLAGFSEASVSVVWPDGKADAPRTVSAGSRKLLRN